ncbi:hypothetical protein N1851_024413 [Merluccius polli]|uniref:Uncharacterized protein n=1 Tax=Merluccius polli TaxID=89951 RepID=A0AA47MEY9_MERPO|nr:hypothetical protein N1851_024413 [Merluccius polli]
MFSYTEHCTKTFSGTFKVLVCDIKTLKVKGRTVKTCQFATSEQIGRVTVVANLSTAMLSGGDPYSISLLDKTCGGKEIKGSMALFSFGVTTCGTRIRVWIPRPPSSTFGLGLSDLHCLFQFLQVCIRLLWYWQHSAYQAPWLDMPTFTLQRFFAIVQLQETVLRSVQATPAPQPTMKSAGDLANDGPRKYGKVVKFLKDLPKVDTQGLHAHGLDTAAQQASPSRATDPIFVTNSQDCNFAVDPRRDVGYSIFVHVLVRPEDSDSSQGTMLRVYHQRTGECIYVNIHPSMASTQLRLTGPETSRQLLLLSGSDEETELLIKVRMSYECLFTGKRNASKLAWE